LTAPARNDESHPFKEGRNSIRVEIYIYPVYIP
jgi:hypothetical protein